MSKDVPAYLLDQQRKSTGDIAQEWNLIEELYNKKSVDKFLIIAVTTCIFGGICQLPIKHRKCYNSSRIAIGVIHWT